MKLMLTKYQKIIPLILELRQKLNLRTQELSILSFSSESDSLSLDRLHRSASSSSYYLSFSNGEDRASSATVLIVKADYIWALNRNYTFILLL